MIVGSRNERYLQGSIKFCNYMLDTCNLDTYCPTAIGMPADGPEVARIMTNGKR